MPVTYCAIGSSSRELAFLGQLQDHGGGHRLGVRRDPEVGVAARRSRRAELRRAVADRELDLRRAQQNHRAGNEELAGGRVDQALQRTLVERSQGRRAGRAIRHRAGAARRARRRGRGPGRAPGDEEGRAAQEARDPPLPGSRRPRRPCRARDQRAAGVADARADSGRRQRCAPAGSVTPATHPPASRQRRAARAACAKRSPSSWTAATSRHDPRERRGAASSREAWRTRTSTSAGHASAIWRAANA